MYCGWLVNTTKQNIKLELQAGIRSVTFKSWFSSYPSIHSNSQSKWIRLHCVVSTTLSVMGYHFDLVLQYCDQGKSVRVTVQIKQSVGDKSISFILTSLDLAPCTFIWLPRVPRANLLLLFAICDCEDFPFPNKAFSFSCLVCMFCKQAEMFTKCGCS